MTQLYAQPYSLDATGFYFEDLEDYQEKVRNLKDRYGQPVEEFEIQLIDAEAIDCDLFKAIGIYQNNIGGFFDAVEEWEEQQKINVIIAVGEGGYNFDFETDSPDDFDVDLYEMDSLKELAEHFVDEGLFGEIPESIQFYLDYELIARDLGMDYTETRIAGCNMIYRMA